MKTVLVLLSTFCIHYAANAQNFVHNPDFIYRTSCPDDLGQVIRADYWYPVTQGTPDYLNSCSPIPSLQVPVNSWGHQSSPSDAMLGLYTFDASGAYREYIGTDIAPLTPGNIYDVTIRVSLADTVKFASDGLGVYFYVNNKPDTTVNNWIPVTPQIDYSDLGIISDRVNWTTLTKQFVADSGYTHLVIGAFKSDADIHLSAPGGTTVLNDVAYYYIDSVAVSVSNSKNVAIKEVPSNSTQEKVKITPNPFKDFTTVTFDNSAGESYKINLYSAQGNLIMQQGNITTGQVRIDRDNLPAGLYYYHLSNEKGALASGKIAIE